MPRWWKRGCKNDFASVAGALAHRRFGEETVLRRHFGWDATTIDGRIIHRTFEDVCESPDVYIDDQLKALRHEGGWKVCRQHEEATPARRDFAHRQWFELTQRRQPSPDDVARRLDTLQVQ